MQEKLYCTYDIKEWLFSASKDVDVHESGLVERIRKCVFVHKSGHVSAVNAPGLGALQLRHEPLPAVEGCQRREVFGIVHRGD